MTISARPIDRRLAVAPMLDWTDRFERYFLRLITRHTLLYSEMMTTGALLRGDATRLLAFDPAEHPVAAQLGGSEPGALAACARRVEAAGYDEVNLNLGCPSDRVRSGRFGACLMAEPERVAECVAAMKQAVALPVTVKCRIGIDHDDSYTSLRRFVRRCSEAGADAIIVHARKAWLQGLSPKENREIPPLRYDRVLRLKRDHPSLTLCINGGITTLAEAQGFLATLDGVMIGREAYHNPWLLVEADRLIFDDPHPLPSRHEVLEGLTPLVERELARGTRLNRITRHILGLFHGQPGARAWRRWLSEHAHLPEAGMEVIREAARRVKG